jgi:hypothetical protein
LNVALNHSVGSTRGRANLNHRNAGHHGQNATGEPSERMGSGLDMGHFLPNQELTGVATAAPLGLYHRADETKKHRGQTYTFYK